MSSLPLEIHSKKDCLSLSRKSTLLRSDALGNRVGKGSRFMPSRKRKLTSSLDKNPPSLATVSKCVSKALHKVIPKHAAKLKES